MPPITIHENKGDYTAAEIAELTQAYNDLGIKAQGGELTIDETRIRVAYIRLQREGNFKIVVEAKKAAKTPKEPKEKVEKPIRKARVTKNKEEVDDIAKAQGLWVRQNLGAILTEEEKAFVERMLPPPLEI